MNPFSVIGQSIRMTYRGEVLKIVADQHAAKKERKRLGKEQIIKKAALSYGTNLEDVDYIWCEMVQK